MLSALFVLVCVMNVIRISYADNDIIVILNIFCKYNV